MVTFLEEVIEEGKEEFEYKPKGAVFELREYQEEAIENLNNMRDKGESIALLYHATGTGKTVTAIQDAKAIGGKTYIFCLRKIVNRL